MNIFILDTDPIVAAKYLCDKHIVKMAVESCQLLSTALPQDKAPYKHTHINHPCAKPIETITSIRNYISPNGN